MRESSEHRGELPDESNASGDAGRTDGPNPHRPGSDSRKNLLDREAIQPTKIDKADQFDPNATYDEPVEPSNFGGEGDVESIDGEGDSPHDSAATLREREAGASCTGSNETPSGANALAVSQMADGRVQNRSLSDENLLDRELIPEQFDPNAACAEPVEPPNFGGKEDVESNDVEGKNLNDLAAYIREKEAESSCTHAGTPSEAKQPASEVKGGPDGNLQAEIVGGASRTTGPNEERFRPDKTDGVHFGEEDGGSSEMPSGANVPTVSQMADAIEKPRNAPESDAKERPRNASENVNDEPGRASETNGNKDPRTRQEDEGGNDDGSPEERQKRAEPPPVPIDRAKNGHVPQTSAHRVKPSPPPTDGINERATPENEAPPLLLGRELLFDDRIINIPAFDDGSAAAKDRAQGWTNSKWSTATDKALRFAAPVLRAAPGRFFWSSDVFEERILAVYSLGPSLGDIILILRPPTDGDEVRRLFPIRGGPELTERELCAFLVVETAADPKTCKLQLSQLTHVTSISTKVQSGVSTNSIRRRRSCFSLLTPTEVATLSAASLGEGHGLSPGQDPNAGFPPDEKALNDTQRCEDAIISALVDDHSLGNSLDGGADRAALRHSVVLGTLHSYVVSGHDQTLKDSLENALRIQNSQFEHERESGDVGAAPSVLNSAVVDARDESGKTALHIACGRRRSSAVQILVGAGADCSVPQTVDAWTPCHICAKGLDEKSLSVVLSARRPTRPDPNALDRHGRTPMYLAAVEGVGERGNPVALDLCLSALEAWGGQLMSDKPECAKLLHPVHCVSAQWKPEVLSVILSHCNYRYPLTGVDRRNPAGISVTAMFHYPIHAALVSLRRRIAVAFSEGVDNEFNVEFMPQEPVLVKTLRTLLEHGFEPNERFEGIVGRGEEIKTLSSYFGTNPLQILALAAVEAKEMDSKKRKSGEDDVESTRIMKNIMRVIRESSDLLLKNGARTNVQPPPPTRLGRATPPGCYSLQEALKDANPLSMPIGYREGLKIDGNEEVLALLGGASRISACKDAFLALGKRFEVAGTLTVGSSSIDSDAPGGSDSSSCAICWSEFGIISNRKHLCRVSLRYVCNDCSTRRLVNISEHRVSDGQFLLARAEAKKESAKLQTRREERMREQREDATRSRKSLGLKSANRPSGSSDSEATKTKSPKEKITSVISDLGRTKNAVLERGDKLQSLADKTDALNQASLDFANMAKELNRSQNSWW